jgi:hypothetical protein
VSKSWRVLWAFLLVLAPVFLMPATASAVVEWVPPNQISTSGQDATTPKVASGNGTAIAVWARFDGSNQRIQAAVRPSGGSFGAPVTLSGAGQDAFEPQVEMDSSGDALVVWTRFDGGVPNRPRIQAAWRPAGGSFGAVQTLSNSTNDANTAQASLDGSGNATVVWLSGSTGTFRIQAAQATNLGTFGTPVTLSDAGRDAFDADVAAEPGGAVAVWTRTDGANFRIEATDRRDVTAGYETPANNGAPSVSVSMVPVFRQCGTGAVPANGGHSPPLTIGGSCLPPVTLGTAHIGNQSVGSATLASAPGDMTYTANITDVRATNATGPDYNPNPGGADMGLDSRFRMTNLNNCSGVGCTGPYTQAATTADITFPVLVDCVSNGDPLIGSTCSAATSLNAINPGNIRVAKHTVISLFRIIARDSGPDGVRGNSDDRQFSQQGFYVP